MKIEAREFLAILDSITRDAAEAMVRIRSLEHALKQQEKIVLDLEVENVKLKQEKQHETN